jgi:hypothetical protein
MYTSSNKQTWERLNLVAGFLSSKPCNNDKHDGDKSGTENAVPGWRCWWCSNSRWRQRSTASATETSRIWRFVSSPLRSKNGGALKKTFQNKTKNQNAIRCCTVIRLSKTTTNPNNSSNNNAPRDHQSKVTLDLPTESDAFRHSGGNK